MTAVVFGGPNPREGFRQFQRLIGLGYHPTIAMVGGHVASFPDCWSFRATIGGAVSRSVRTVQRCLTTLKTDGIMGIHRSKPAETPRGARGPIHCGFSHRYIVGANLAGEAVKQAVEQARAKASNAKFARIISKAMFPSAPAPAPAPAPAAPAPAPAATREQWANARHYTRAQLDAELARRTTPPPEEPQQLPLPTAAPASLARGLFAVGPGPLAVTKNAPARLRRAATATISGPAGGSV